MRRILPINAKKIKHYRIIKGMTVIELAEQLKMTRASIYNYEKGIQFPPPKVLAKISKVLRVKPQDLMGE